MRGFLSMRQTVLAAFLISVLTVSGGMSDASPAEAANNRVTIGKIATKTAPYGGKVKIVPHVTQLGQTEVSKKTLTVRQGKRTLVSGKSSASLNPGKYQVTQSVTYRTYTVKKTTADVRKVVVGAPAFRDVNVRCKATRVTPDDQGDVKLSFGLSIIATCKSSAFDGSHSFAGWLMNDNGDGSLWSGFNDSNLDELTVRGTPVVGREFAAVLVPEGDLPKTTYVKKTTSKKVYSAHKTVTSKAQTLTIKQGKKPAWVWGNGGYDCPKGFPIKGNADSGIYHVRGGAYYSRTIPEQCFATDSAARAQGYRKSKR